MKRVRVSPAVVGRSLVAVLPLAVAAAALAQQLSVTKAADSATVPAGMQIGFAITVTNVAQMGSVQDLTLSDSLPGGPGVNWSLPAAPANCILTGAPPTQSISCNAAALLPGFSWNIHATSGTNVSSCGTYNNTVSVTASNTKGGTRNASTTVQCPALTVNHAADAVAVDVGSPIGFTTTVANSAGAGIGAAINLAISDYLPTFPGNVWSFAPPVAGCSMVTSAGDFSPIYRFLCHFDSVDPGQTVSVHVTSPTSNVLCNAGTLPSPGHYHNTAVVAGGNFPYHYMNALATVRCPSSPAFTSPNSVRFGPGAANSFFVTATGTPPPTFALAGALPGSIALDPATGELHGTPSAMDIGAWPVTLTAKNGVVTDATQAFALVVAYPPCSLDIDGDSKTDAMTDGLMLVRAMLGMTGTAVTQGALGASPGRDTWQAIRDYLNTRCGTSFQ